MEQREVTDQEGTLWTCVQAYGGMEGKNAEKAKELSEAHNKVPVVCTPSGGAQSVRLQLKPNWLKELEDEVLITAIAHAQAE